MTHNNNPEIAHKLDLIRRSLRETDAIGIRLRGTDWFAWATAGGSNTVLLAAEMGIAEVLVTAEQAWILTDEIEAQRLQDEELPQGDYSYSVSVNPWADVAAREVFVRDVTSGGKVLSDRLSLDAPTESPLPISLINAKRLLLLSEVDRYRRVGRLASEAMTEVLSQAQPSWTEYQLAGAGAKALWVRGLHPTLTLVAGERRLPLYRHATATGESIGNQAMLVFCARGQGLYANLTRFVSFRALAEDQVTLHQTVRSVESAMLDACKPDVPLNTVYEVATQTYAQHGYPQAIREHHQGGTTGYLSREIVATPLTIAPLVANTAMAWNPSLVGAKIEDTFILHEGGQLENLTFDPNWPSITVAGRDRPLPWER